MKAAIIVMFGLIDDGVSWLLRQWLLVTVLVVQLFILMKLS